MLSLPQKRESGILVVYTDNRGICSYLLKLLLSPILRCVGITYRKRDKKYKLVVAGLSRIGSFCYNFLTLNLNNLCHCTKLKKSSIPYDSGTIVYVSLIKIDQYFCAICKNCLLRAILVIQKFMAGHLYQSKPFIEITHSPNSLQFRFTGLD